MRAIAGIVFLISLIFGTAASAVLVHRRQRKARKLHPPEGLRFRRGPGESMRRKADELGDRFAVAVFVGPVVSIFLLAVPFGIVLVAPEANRLLLLASGAALFASGLALSTRHCVKLIDENARLRLGRMGECVVAEALEMTLASGCRVFHDVPIEGEWGQANIDHVVVGHQGAAVVETKMRAKPADKSTRENRVIYDGKTLAWPRCSDDSKTLWQVRKNAEWLAAYFQKECGLSVPVRQVVAIPGWNVVEKVLGQPRVVRGESSGDAVLQTLDAAGGSRLTNDQFKRLVAAMDALCRDVEI